MGASERASIAANAISDGINALAQLRSLRGEPHLVRAAELDEWNGIFDRVQSTLVDMGVEIRAGRAQTSFQITNDLVRSFADLRARLSTIAPGTQIPVPLFDLADVAWSEITKPDV